MSISSIDSSDVYSTSSTEIDSGYGSQKGSSGKNAVYVWDGTVPEALISFDDLKARFMDLCKSWTFQKEKAASGLVHYQCRISFKTKVRGTAGVIPGHWSPTSKGCMNDMSRYVTKCDTRIDGPWCDKDVIELPDDWLEGIEEAYPWQRSIIDQCRGAGNGRVVNVLVDTEGGIGKGTVTEMAVKELPYSYTSLKASANARDMRLEVASYLKGLGKHIYHHKTITFMIDMPRSENMTQEGWSVIESIKGRQLTETRYSTTVIHFKIPHVWVFTNQMPDKKYLSKDRWRIWNVVNGELIQQGPQVATLPAPAAPPSTPREYSDEDEEYEDMCNGDVFIDSEQFKQ